ncbi:hypothetical protein V7S43_011266 [Phytophthora oleae]|uniref:Uncharacterized protein n=1 Tax=Phytophthora oleae TaxID=2107226 RepID=A0ABD3FC33_9STRA
MQVEDPQEPTRLDPVKLTRSANEKIFTLLKEKLGDKVKLKKSKSAQVVKTRHFKYYTDPKKLKSQSSKIEVVIQIRIEDTYKIPEVKISDLAAKVALKATKYIVKTFGEKEEFPIVLTPEQIEQLQKAFTETEYMGDAHVKFGQYLRQCYEAYNPDQFKAPYVTVMQSSGCFGRTRSGRRSLF